MAGNVRVHHGFEMLEFGIFEEAEDGDEHLEDQTRVSRGVAVFCVKHGKKGVQYILQKFDQFLAVQPKNAAESLRYSFRVGFPLQQAQEVDILR